MVARSNILRHRLPVSRIEFDSVTNQDVKTLVPRSEFDPEFILHSLQAHSEVIRLATVRTDGSMAAIKTARFMNYRIAVPTLTMQHQIAKRLTGFSNLINDQSMGIPAEIAARRQQYEYYRDRLLTFKELSA